MFRKVRVLSARVSRAVRVWGLRGAGSSAIAARFRALMASLSAPVDELTFVDLGAGKGRAMLLASELPFRRIVGVEFSPELCDVARRNLRTNRRWSMSTTRSRSR